MDTSITILSIIPYICYAILIIYGLVVAFKHYDDEEKAEKAQKNGIKVVICGLILLIIQLIR